MQKPARSGLQWKCSLRIRLSGTASMPSRAPTDWRAWAICAPEGYKSGLPGTQKRPCGGPSRPRLASDRVRFAEQGLRIGLVPVEEFAFHIRPEFLHDLREGVRGAGNPQPFDVVGRGARVRIVGVRYSDGRGIPQPFRVIELLAAVIGAADENTRRRVSRPVQDAAAAAADPEIARILVEQARHDALRHHVADDLVAQSRAVSPPVTLHALPERRVLVFELVEEREGSRHRINGPIERVLQADGELLPAGNRLKRHVAVSGPVVWKDSEDALVLLLRLGAIGSTRRVRGGEYRRGAAGAGRRTGAGAILGLRTRGHQRCQGQNTETGHETPWKAEA